jgi:hypothetical protein
MSYLIYVAAFGAAVVFFLWLRDARIFYRTGYAGYRTAAYRGVLYGALALLGASITFTTESFEILGLGLILAALYLQGRLQREKVWTTEDTAERITGRVRIKKAGK